MKVCFISNYFNHHQEGLCDELYKLTNANFYFIENDEVSNNRLRLGYKDLSKSRPYLIQNNEKNKSKIKKIVAESDFIINSFSEGLKLIKEEMKKQKIIFWYNERLFKDYSLLKSAAKLIRSKFFFNYGHNLNQYVLCASHYGYKDMLIINKPFFQNRCFSFGYFPVLLSKAKANRNTDSFSLLFVGRLIKWKKPSSVLDCLEFLISKGIKVNCTFVGIGPEKNRLIRIIKRKSLSPFVTFIPGCSVDSIQNYYLGCDCLIFSSNREEGWGAVLNEALYYGCVPIANFEAGSTLSLIKDGFNGFVYKSKKEMLKKVYCLASFKKSGEIDILRKNGHETITKEWNYSCAARRLYSVFNYIGNESNEEVDLFKKGELMCNEKLNNSK